MQHFGTKIQQEDVPKTGDFRFIFHCWSDDCYSRLMPNYAEVSSKKLESGPVCYTFKIVVPSDNVTLHNYKLLCTT